MKLRNWLIYAGICIAALTTACATTLAHADTTISNGPTNDSVDYFGTYLGANTFGEIIEAPVTGELTSFTLSLDGGVTSLYGGVGTWSNTTYGSPTNLYKSADIPSTGPASYTFSPDVSVVAGETYVVYLSVYGDPSSGGVTSVPSVISNLAPYPLMSPYLEGYEFNFGDELNNPSWTQGAPSPEDNLLVSATFSPIVISAAPEPSAWALMIAGIGLVGGIMRRRGRVSFRDITAA